MPPTIFSTFLLASCAPMSVGPPPTQIPSGHTQEFGSTVGTGVQIEEEEIQQIFLEESFWYRHVLSDKSEVQLLGGMVWNGDPIVFGAVGFRRYFTTADGGKFGIDVKVGGPFYAEIGLPLQQQLGDRSLWLTTHPSVALNGFGHVNLPVGLNWQPKDKWFVSSVFGTRFVGENPMLFYSNLGVSIPF